MKRKYNTQSIVIALGKYLMFLPVLLVLNSCDVHQFPEPKVEPDLPEEKINVPLRLVYQPTFYVWDHTYDPLTGKIVQNNPDLQIYENHPGSSRDYDNTQIEGVMDVHVKAYLSNNTNKVIEEKTFTFTLGESTYDKEIDIDLPIGQNYVLAVWSHLREHTDKAAYYEPKDFNKVSIISANYDGNTDYRDAFSGTINIDTYGEAASPYKVDMTRPMGKFELVTIDLAEFLDRETTRRSLATRAKAEDYNVIVSFSYYYPSSYSLLDDRLENATTGVNFKTKMTVTGDKEASLGFEYVMLNNTNDSGVQMKVDIYDPSYTRVAGSTVLTIPMRRDDHTVLRGEFLSQEGEGGVGIDPGFNGDHNVIW